jgi:hypothetical protein
LGVDVSDYRGRLDPEHCKAGVWSREGWSRQYQCTRKAKVDGYCKQHHPDAVKRRREESDARWRAEEKVKRDRWRYQLARLRAWDEVVRLLRSDAGRVLPKLEALVAEVEALKP